jgi:hypothetical protein
LTIAEAFEFFTDLKVALDGLQESQFYSHYNGGSDALDMDIYKSDAWDMDIGLGHLQAGCLQQDPSRSNLRDLVADSRQFQKLVDGHILDDDVEGRITEVFGERVRSIQDVIKTLYTGFQHMAKDLRIDLRIDYFGSFRVESSEIPGYVTFRGWENFSRRSLVKEQFCFQVIQ